MTFIQVQGESSEHKGLSRSSQGPSGSPLDSTSDTRAVKMLTEAHYSCQAYMSIHRFESSSWEHCTHGSWVRGGFKRIYGSKART